MTHPQTARLRDRVVPGAGAPGDRGAADGAVLPGAIDLGPLLGAWQSYDVDTTGILRADITADDGKLIVSPHSSGSELPPWTAITAAAFAIGVAQHEAVGFLAQCQRGPARILLAAYLNKRLLVVDTFTRYADPTADPNHFLRDHLYLVAPTTR